MSAETHPTKAFLTAAELAERWAVTTGHLANRRCTGLGPTYVKIGGAVRYRISDVEQFEADSEVAA